MWLSPSANTHEDFAFPLTPTSCLRGEFPSEQSLGSHDDEDPLQRSFGSQPTFAEFAVPDGVLLDGARTPMNQNLPHEDSQDYEDSSSYEVLDVARYGEFLHSRNGRFCSGSTTPQSECSAGSGRFYRDERFNFRLIFPLFIISLPHG